MFLLKVLADFSQQLIQSSLDMTYPNFNFKVENTSENGGGGNGSGNGVEEVGGLIP